MIILAGAVGHDRLRIVIVLAAAFVWASVLMAGNAVDYQCLTL